MRAHYLAVAVILALPSSAAAIHGGRLAKKSEGMAAVKLTATGYRYRGQCSGVLVSPNKVLTAAHCVRRSNGKKLRVRRVRIGNPRGKTVTARVRSVHVHPSYDPKRPGRGNDIAVLLLRRPVKGVTPIPLASEADDPAPAKKLRIHGFGLIRKGRRLVSSRHLRVAKLEALSPFACFSGPVKEMAKTRMCAANPRAGMCPGDSGAGAIYERDGKRVVVGIVSIVLDSGHCHRGPTIMSRVSTYASWVRGIGAETK